MGAHDGFRVASRSGAWRPRSTPDARVRQRGVVLYIAMIVLILLSLIGVIGMKVASLEERMTANYRNTNLAFQAAEAEVRQRECYLQGLTDRTGDCASSASAIEMVCDNGFDPTRWAGDLTPAATAGDRVVLRAIGACLAGNSSGEGTPVSENPNPVFQVTVYATDASGTAAAAVDTIYRP